MSAAGHIVPVVLASASPRRRELLRMLGLSFEPVAAEVDESWRPGEEPAAHAERLARTKAAAVATDGAVVIGADTIVVLDGEILGKPRDAEEAARMLGRLSGRRHVVHTAVAARWGEKTACRVQGTSVSFRRLSPETIAAYVGTGEPLDKAGAYGIQGYGAVLVERIEGDYFTVMGLGLGTLVEVLAGLGLAYTFGAIRTEPDRSRRHGGPEA